MLEVIDNKFRIVRTLGKGGNGTVYVAWNDSLQKEVAVKVLNDTSPDSSEVKRFQQEARALSTCDHPGIVHVSSFGVTEDRRLYYAMDFIDGTALATEIAEHGPLTPKRFANVFDEVLAALEHAHSKGLVHRDIKPSNIMLTTYGGTEHPILIDFGLTRLLEKSVKLTKTDAVVGTPYYMSPEQCLGKPVDERGDLYSLGCTMLEAATGKPPFSGEAIEVLMAQLHQAPDTVPRELIPLLEGMLNKDPEKRFASAAEAREVLRSLRLEQFSQFTTGKHSVGAPDQAHTNEPSNRKQQVRLAITATAILFISAAGIYAGAQWIQLKQTEQRAQAPAAPNTVHWKLTRNRASELSKDGKIAESAEMLGQALDQLEAEDPQSKIPQLSMAYELLAISRKVYLPPRYWEKHGLKAIANAHDLKLPKPERDFRQELGRLYACAGNVTAANAMYNQAFKITEELKPSPDDQRNSPYISHAAYIGAMGEKDTAGKSVRRSITMILEQERDPAFINTPKCIVWEVSTFEQLPIAQAASDPKFLKFAIQELYRPVTDPSRQVRRLVWRGLLALENKDKTAAQADINKAYAIAIRVPEKPRTLAAWTLHEKMMNLNLPPNERIALGKQALALCMETPSNPKLAAIDSVASARQQLAQAYEVAGQFEQALEQRNHAVDLDLRMLKRVDPSMYESEYNARLRYIYDLNTVVYDAVKCNKPDVAKPALQAAQSELQFLRTKFTAGIWQLATDRYTEQLKRAQQGLEPAP